MTKNKFLWSGVAFAVGGLLSLISTSHPSARSDAAIPAFYRPSADLSPADVVQRQLTALQSGKKEPDAFRWCYQFASPSNRARIGSMDKFTELLQGSIYAPLVGHQERLVGRPTIVANEATLLVTVINESGLPSVFRFILRRQDSDPFEHCWMTTAVIPSMQFGGGPLDQPDLSASGIRTVDKNRPNERHDGE